MSNILFLFIMRIAFIFQNFSYLKTGSKCFLVGNLINELWSLHTIDCLALCHVKEADLKRLHTIWDTRKNKTIGTKNRLPKVEEGNGSDQTGDIREFFTVLKCCVCCLWWLQEPMQVLKLIDCTPMWIQLCVNFWKRQL